MTATFVQAGTGLAITGASDTVSMSGCVAGNLIVLQVLNDGDDTSTFSSITNISNLAGSASSLSISSDLGNYQVGASALGTHQIRFGRATSNGTCSVTVSTGGGFDAFTRLYEFSSVATGTTVGAILENADDGTYNEISQVNNTNTSMFPPDIVTGGDNRLAIALSACVLNQTFDAFTGGSGSWSEPVGEFGSATGTDGVIGIQTAPMAAAGTISGATDTITSAGWQVVGFALKPLVGQTLLPGDNPPIGILGRGAGW